MAAVPQVSIYKFYFNGEIEYKYKCVPHNDAGDGTEATVRLNINGG